MLEAQCQMQQIGADMNGGLNRKGLPDSLQRRVV
jgi:hypothetical protein